ncbi:MAG: hypothetical protein ACI91F_001663 [Candidatus Binatia bacterium]
MTSKIDGRFPNESDGGGCANLVLGVIFRALEEQPGTLNVALISIDGFDLPLPVARCLFRSVTTPTIDDFEFSDLDAANTDSVPVTPPPTIAITAISPLDN